MENSDQSGMRNEESTSQDRQNEILSIIVGPSGHGKSTLINYLASYFSNSTLDSKKAVIPTDKYKVTETGFSDSEHGDPKSSSQSGSCTKYEFLDPKSSHKYTFFNTPGLNDTLSAAQIDKNIDKLLETFVSITSLHAIILVINGSAARLHESVKNTLSRLRNSLPLSLRKNIIAIYTNSSDTLSFDKSFIPFKVKKDYIMDNCAYINSPEEYSRMNEVEKAMINNKWTISMETIEEILKDLWGFANIGTINSSTTRMEINALKISLYSIRKYLKMWLDIKDEIKAIENKKIISDREAFDNKDYTSARKLIETVYVETPYHNTVCSKCDSLCHEKCCLGYTPNTHSITVKSCSCISGDNCRKCQCSYEHHHHVQKKPEKVEKEITEEISEKKSKYILYINESNELTAEKSRKEIEYNECNKRIELAKEEIKKTVKILKTISPDYNILLVIQLKIDSEKKAFKATQDHKVMELKSAIIKVLQEVMHFVRN